MNNFKYSILFSALLLASCGGESDDEDVVSIKQQAVTEQTTENSTAQTPIIEDSSELLSNEETIETPHYDEEAPEVEQVIKLIDLNKVTPTKITIHNIESTVKLQWSPVQGAVGYNVYHNENQEVSESSTVFSITAPNFTHEFLDANLHSYKVQAVFNNSLSNLSSPASADLSNYISVIADTDY